MNKYDTKRDTSLDIIKGIATILVVVGHLMQRYIIHYAELPFFNIVWALQIPLFMFVSGLLCVKPISSKPILDIVKLFASYMLPFLSYLLIIKVVCLKEFEGSFLKAIVYSMNHLETSLWFLFVLFFLQVMGKCAIRASSKQHSMPSQIVCFLISWGAMLVPFLILGMLCGMKFLGSKYVLYYSLYFAFGQMIAKGWNFFSSLYSKHILLFQTILIVAFWVPVANINLYTVADNMLGIISRLVAGISGSLLILIICKAWKNEGKIRSLIYNSVGRHTLEIYAAHMLFHIPLQPQQWGTLNAILTVVSACVYMIVFTVLYIFVFGEFKITDFLLFGHWKPFLKEKSHENVSF